MRFPAHPNIAGLILACLLAPLAHGEVTLSLRAPMPAEEAFARLQANTPVRWLARMVAYDPANPTLRIDHLKTLGGAAEDYTFVNDYEELRGYTGREAMRKAGTEIDDAQGVSLILFPIGSQTIFPASVRGMLQVVGQIDMRRAAESGYRAAPLDVLLTDAERANLAAVDLPSWAWNSYRDHFRGFAQAFSTLRGKNGSAIGHIEPIGPAWCEPGCSRLLKPRTPADKNVMKLTLTDRSTFEIKNFGVRVFLIRNLAIDALPGRILIDFKDPENELIPNLDLQPASAPGSPSDNSKAK